MLTTRGNPFGNVVREGDKVFVHSASGLDFQVPALNSIRLEKKRDGSAAKTPGKATEARGYLRWENPVLGINGEGRVSPIIPGCQQITTVIGPDGKPIVLNKIWRTTANLENSGPEGQRGIDMAPAAPHTRAWQARFVRFLPHEQQSIGLWHP